MKPVLIDSNVILNVWRKETNPATGESLSRASKDMLKAVARGEIHGLLLSTTAMELIHKMRVDAELTGITSPSAAVKQAEKNIAEIGLKILVPDSIVMAMAYEFLADYHIDPFDAILVGAAVAEDVDTVISRDKKLKKKVSKLISILTPEEFLLV
jgi:predicted nucleic acid-binding protein